MLWTTQKQPKKVSDRQLFELKTEERKPNWKKRQRGEIFFTVKFERKKILE